MVNHISFPNLGLEFDVSRSILRIFGMDIYTYGLIIALGLCLGFVYASHEAKHVGLKSDDLLNMFMLAVPIAIVSARLYYVVFSWDSYKNDFWSIFNIRSGGLAVYGGIIGAAVTIFVYTRKNGIKTGLVLDILAVGLLIGQSIGRWGNFVNGEAFGSTTNLPWAMTIKEGETLITAYAHPTFLYESIFCAVGIIVLTLYKRVKCFDGELTGMYMLWYGTGRMLIEGLRTDSLYIGALRVSQLLSASIAFIGLAVIIVGRGRYKKEKIEG